MPRDASAPGVQRQVAVSLVRVKLRVLLAAATLTLAAAPAADAAGWTQLTASGGYDIDQVALLRTSDGVLHVAWHQATDSNTADLMQAPIAASGKVGATRTIAAGWADIDNPALVTAPGGGLRAFWGGIRTTNPDETNQDLNTALSTDGGATWALQTGSVVPAGTAAYDGPVTAATVNGTPLEAWAGSAGTWVHAGLDPATPSFNYQSPLGNYGYDAALATDSAGTAMLAWYSNADGHLGVFAQAVGAGGASVGGPLNMPGTADLNIGQVGRTPLVARPKAGGFYVLYPASYPDLNRVRLWRVGASTSTLIAKTTDETSAALAADAQGRLWAVWKDRQKILARRSNKTATVFGATVEVAPPKSASNLYRIDASAAASGLDLFGSFSIAGDPSVSTYRTRILPGLTLTAKPGRLRAKPRKVTFTVSDAGALLKGARVKAGGKAGTTDAKGRVTLMLKGKASATATLKGYVGATLKLK
jgi:hypothetical protein